MNIERHTLRGCSFWDWEGSSGFKYVSHEIRVGAPGSGTRCYDLQKGDVVIDIGAHIGMLSIIMAKANPFVNFFSFEPMEETFEILKLNIRENSADNVHAFNLGIAGKRCKKTIAANLDDNTGCSTMWGAHPSYTYVHEVDCITLDDAWEIAGGGQVKLLKIDCEGAEHEFIDASKDSVFWESVVHCAGELHENQFIKDLGYSNVQTLALINKLVRGSVRFQSIEIGG